jgi:hypothetical protein
MLTNDGAAYQGIMYIMSEELSTRIFMLGDENVEGEVDAGLRKVGSGGEYFR